MNQFRSRVQRDEWIKNQMKSQAKAIKDKENTIAKLTEEIKKDDERRAQLEKDLEGAEENLNTVRTELDAVSWFCAKAPLSFLPGLKSCLLLFCLGERRFASST